MREWLRNRRQELGLTMKDVAKKLDITESYYCTIENGQRQKNMNIVLVSGLSAVLEMPVAEIIRLEAETHGQAEDILLKGSGK